MKINLIGHLVNVGKTNPNKPNSNPKQTQFPQRDTQYAIRDTKYKPKQSQFQYLTQPLIGVEFTAFLNLLFACRPAPCVL